MNIFYVLKHGLRHSIQFLIANLTSFMSVFYVLKLNANFYRVKAETDHEERQVNIAARDFMRNQIIILAVAATFVAFEQYIDPYWFLKFSIYYVLLRCLFIVLLD
jgi:NADH:ubiquinone oxidoreductase subunit 5 (subunit L)/multisubunit Na+/H+ antiporter MnhA subunit